MKYFLSLLVVVLSMVSCAQLQGQAPAIREMLYPSEVPAFFDTVLMVRTWDSGNENLKYQWSAENGTIRGQGDSITWNSPSEYGIYKIYAKVINSSGQGRTSQCSINVVPFYRTQVDPDPEINLQLPIIGSSMVSEQSLVGPLTSAEIKCEGPSSNIKNYRYEWSCNGGKMQGTGLQDGTASIIGWLSPGVPGNYTVTVKAFDTWGGITIGSVYFLVKNPSCCGSADTAELYKWKQ